MTKKEKAEYIKQCGEKASCFNCDYLYEVKSLFYPDKCGLTGDELRTHKKCKNYLPFVSIYPGNRGEYIKLYEEYKQKNKKKRTKQHE